MSILGEIPLSKSHRVILSFFHFFTGAFLGLFPALIGVSLFSMAPNANYWNIIGFILLICCLPLGLLFAILGLIGRGKIILGLFRLLGRHVS